MSRSFAERRGDVERLVDAARAVARDRASIADALVEATGLSPEGVELAFARHLELDPTSDEVASLVVAAGDASEVVVVLSANVFVGALRAIALARAASGVVRVRPSRREPHFARALVERARDPGLSLAQDIDLARVGRGEVHVYGRDRTIAEVRAAVGGRARVRGHGAGMGIAVVSEGAALEEAASALVQDVIAFDQRGCLSPRAAVVLGPESRAVQFAEALDRALTDAATRVPRGFVADDERAGSARYEATMRFVGRVYPGRAHLVAVAPPGAPLAVPPAGRHLHIASAPTLADARALLTGLAPFLVALGCDDPRTAEALAPAHARRSPLGGMQRPRLDGPVDRRDPWA